MKQRLFLTARCIPDGMLYTSSITLDFPNPGQSEFKLRIVNVPDGERPLGSLTRVLQTGHLGLWSKLEAMHERWKMC